MSIRIDVTTEERLDTLARLMTERAGAEVLRAAVLRAAIDRGIESLESELGAKPKKRSK